jgi:hypothetical protein
LFNPPENPTPEPNEVNLIEKCLKPARRSAALNSAGAAEARSTRSCPGGLTQIRL